MTPLLPCPVNLLAQSVSLHVCARIIPHQQNIQIEKHSASSCHEIFCLKAETKELKLKMILCADDRSHMRTCAKKRMDITFILYYFQ